MGDGRGACRILVERPEGNGILRRPGHRREENIKMDIEELGWAGMDWIDQAQDRDRYADAFECGSEPFRSIQFGKFLD
jgi:hypothetical protein